MAAACAWARPSIVSVSRVHGHTPLLGISSSGRWRLWLLSVGDRIEIDGSRSRRRLWSAAAPDASSRRGFGNSRVVTVRASHVNSAGSIDSPLMQSMADKIKEHLNAEFVDVKDAYGDGRHVRMPAVITQPPQVLLQLDELPLEICPFLSKSRRNIPFSLKCLVTILAAAMGYKLITDHYFSGNPITAAGIEFDYVIDSIDVVACSFEGQSAVTRQRMVYKAIWEELQSTVHAVDQMTTRTPGEARAGTD